MTKFLYWLVYNFDLGRLGPMVLDLAVQSWLSDARREARAPVVRLQALSPLTRSV